MSNSQKDLPHGDAPAPANEGTVDYLRQYIDASAGSANRTRFVLIVMVTASVLALLAMWNSRPGNMTLARVMLAADAERFYDPVDKKTILPDEQVKPLFTADGNFDEKAFNAAKKFAEQSRTRFADLDHLKRYVEWLERTRVERVVNVSVPFFGIVFDVNDLGVFAGASFFIILLLFRFSLVRELRNVRLVFMRARTVEQLELCYNRLAMQQVLTNPPPLDYKPPDETFREGTRWRPLDENFLARLRGLVWDTIVPGLLYVLPLIAHLAIFRNDWRTYGRVKDLYPNMSFTLTVSGVFLLINMLLTALCLSLGTQLNRTWRNHARFIIKHRPVNQEGLVEEEAVSEDGISETESAAERPTPGEADEAETKRRGTDKE